MVFGERIREVLSSFLDSYRPDVLCFDGQITGSSAMFLASVEEACRMRGIYCYIKRDTSLRTLQGLTRL